MNERERIELLMKCYDLSPSQFAEKTGIQRASVSHIISGRNKPSLEVMLKIYEAFPSVDMKWWMMGVGEEPVPQKALEVAEAVSETHFPESATSRLQAESGLFAPVEPAPQVFEESKPRRVAMPQPREKQPAEARQKRSQSGRLAQMMPLSADKKIKEVRIYYSDGTYETLVPER